MSDQNRRRVRRSLDAVADALDFAASQAENQGWRWVAISVCIALQGALVAALSSYDSAAPEDVTAPDAGSEPRIAAVPTLLRRAASPDYLEAPERLSGLTGAKRQALALVELRNRAVHLALDGAPVPVEDVARHLPGALAIIRHLVLDHPAFAAEDGAATRARLTAALARLSRIMC